MSTDWKGKDKQSLGPSDRRDVVERGEHVHRPEPYVEGPTGPAPLASELRGDPGAEGDRTAEGGAAAGALAGTAVAGPLGGIVGGVVGATIGTAADEKADIDDPGREHVGRDVPHERGSEGS